MIGKARLITAIRLYGEYMANLSIVIVINVYAPVPNKPIKSNKIPKDCRKFYSCRKLSFFVFLEEKK